MVSDHKVPNATATEPERTNTVIIGAGPAGISLSIVLSRDHLRDHVVLEAGEKFQSWKHLRWDSFRLNTTPKTSWLPGEEHLAQSEEPAGEPRDNFLARWEALTKQYDLPIREHARVVSVQECDMSGSEDADGPRFQITLADGHTYLARNVVAAVGAASTVKLPSYASELRDGVQQWWPGKYTNPDALGDGAVLVVGSAQTGGQIARELLLAGKEVLLSTGKVGAAPRTYRGLDLLEYYGPAFGLTKDIAPPELLKTSAKPTVGPDCGITVHSLSRLGAVLVGRCTGANPDGGGLDFADDLAANVEFADAKYQGTVGMIEKACAARIEAEGKAFEQTLTAYKPEETSRPCEKLMSYMQSPKRTVRFAEDGVTDVFWATGFKMDDAWLQVKGVRDDRERRREAGDFVEIETPVPGFFWIGQPWCRNLGSDVLLGFRGDAEHIAQKLKA